MTFRSGFTIIELIIVCVVLAILGTISAFGYAAVQSSARDNLRAQKMNEWATVFNNYKTRYQLLPAPTDTTPTTSGVAYCLYKSTSPATATACDTVAADAVNSPDLFSQLVKVGQLPKADFPRVGTTTYGPYITIAYDNTSGEVTSAVITAPFESNNCEDLSLTTNAYSTAHPSSAPYFCDKKVK